MQKNIQNNWRSRLDDPDSYPGETIRDKNEAWEKLYSKLHKKPRRRFLARYWAAAALLIVTSTVVLFVVEKKDQDSFVSIPSPAKKIKLATKKNVETTEQKNSGYVLSQPKQKIRTVVSYQKNAFVKTISPITKKLITDSITEFLPKMVMTSSVIHDSTIKTTITTTPVKKKLRVVHMNEIGQPIDEPMVNSRLNERRPFEFRIINGEIYNPANTSSSNNGLILIKPHNTSN